MLEFDFIQRQKLCTEIFVTRKYSSTGISHANISVVDKTAILGKQFFLSLLRDRFFLRDRYCLLFLAG